MLSKEELICKLSDEVSNFNLDYLKDKYEKISSFKPREDLTAGFFHTEISKKYLSPISISSHNLASDYLIVLQDWAGKDSFKKNISIEQISKIRDQGYNDNMLTNQNLDYFIKKYLSKKGRGDVYMINSFPFIKTGGTQGSISYDDLSIVNEKFTSRFIEIMGPKYILAMGVSIYKNLANLSQIDKSLIKERRSFKFLQSDSKVLFLYHPGAWGTGRPGTEKFKSRENLWLENFNSLDQV